jgi:hypothetical protein
VNDWRRTIASNPNADRLRANDQQPDLTLSQLQEGVGLSDPSGAAIERNVVKRQFA